MDILCKEENRIVEPLLMDILCKEENRIAFIIIKNRFFISSQREDNFYIKDQLPCLKVSFV